jgi:hypothetical protein
MYLARLLGIKDIDKVQMEVSLEPRYVILTAMHNLHTKIKSLNHLKSITVPRRSE